MIDFSDPSSYRGINSDDLAIYVKLEQAHLNREIENVLGEGGTFSTHSTDEFARLQEDFDSAYASYVKGMALLSMGWYRTPMVPGGPDPMTFTKVVGSIALSCTLGPWAAFALNAALTGVDVADGTMTWQQGAIQIGISAATTGVALGAQNLGAAVGSAYSLSSTGTAVATAAIVSASTTTTSTLLSGFRYDPTKSGWGSLYDTDAVFSTDTWEQAGVNAGTSFAASSAAAGLNATGYGSSFTRAVTGGAINTIGQGIYSSEGGWGWDVGWKEGAINTFGNYMGEMASSGLAGGMGIENDYTKQLINNFASYAGRRALGSGEALDWNQLTNINTLSITAKLTPQFSVC